MNKDVRCPKCGGNEIYRSYVTQDWGKLEGIDDGRLTFAEPHWDGTPEREGIECLSCGIVLKPHEIQQIIVEAEARGGGASE